MSVDGITTVVSRSAIPEKVQEVTERAADNKHLATTVVVQEKTEKKTKTVQDANKSDASNKMRRNEDADNDPGKRKKKQGKGKNKNTPLGKILDLKA